MVGGPMTTGVRPSMLDLGMARRCRVFAQRLAIGVSAIGGLALIGWWLQLDALTRLMPSHEPIKANNAAAIVLVGAGLWLTARDQHARLRTALGIAIALIGALTLSQDLFGASFGIDELLASHPDPAANTMPGRMSPLSACMLMMFGGALALTQARVQARISQALFFIALGVSFALMCGYTYDARKIYAPGPHAAVSLYTTVAFILASFAGLLARPNLGLIAVATSDSSAGALVRRLMPTLMLFPVALGWLRLRGQEEGLYDTPMGVALLVVSSTMVLSFVTLLIASSLRRAEYDLKQSVSRLNVLADCSREFAISTTDYDRLLDAITRKLGEELGELCGIRLLTKDGLALERSGSVYHADPSILELATSVILKVPQAVGQGMSGRIAATGEPLLIPFIPTATLAAQAEPSYRAFLEKMQACSVLGVPLTLRGRVIGVINLVRSTSFPPYTSDDLTLARDIADRAALAIENAQLINELEQRVASRTEALAVANSELESFSYSVSHDLRAPLRAIDGFSQALLADYDSVLDGTARHYLTRVRAATQRMGQLIDDLLSLAQLQRAELKPATLNLSEMAESVVSELRIASPERAVEVVIQSGLVAQADRRFMRLVLENLLGNAWKFSEKVSAARIEVGCTQIGDETVFSIRDNGAGFDMTYAHKLFGPFQRLHAFHEYEGTGIGLATVARAIARHGGRIWAEAKVGEGATFFFTLHASTTESTTTIHARDREGSSGATSAVN